MQNLKDSGASYPVLEIDRDEGFHNPIKLVAISFTHDREIIFDNAVFQPIRIFVVGLG